MNNRKKKPGIYLFKPFGFEVTVNPSWFFLAFLIAWTLAVGYFPFTVGGLTPLAYWVMGICGAVGLFFCIIFHELCHSLVGRRYGLPITGIQLFIFGGVAEMSQEPASAKTEFLMAAAGPVSSFFLGVCFYGIWQWGVGAQWPSSVNAVLRYLGFINIALAIFNLLPGFPLDGGRIFRSILWGWKKDFKWATRIASSYGVGMGWVLIVLGIVLFLRGAIISGVWMGLIGFFLKTAAQSSYQNFLIQEAFHGEKIRRYIKTSLITVPSDISVQQWVDDYFHRHYYKLYPVTENGQWLGYISFDDVKTIPRENWSQTMIRQVMQPCATAVTIEADSSVVEALQKMVTEKVGRLIILDKGALYGVISLRDLTHIIALKMNL
jgi:Zn-dependent protease/predicted transcriptional regulator